MTSAVEAGIEGAAFERDRRRREQLGEILKRAAMLPAARETVADVEAASNGTAADLMLALQQVIQQDIFRVAVVGEYSSGKSSLLNLLLDMCNVHGKKTEGALPTAIVPTTAVITTIYFSEKPAIEVILKDDTRFQASRADLSAFLSDRTLRDRRFPWEGNAEQNEAVASRMREVRVGWHSSLLSHGVEVEDTPGLGSVHAEHGWITRREVARVDAVIFMLSVDPPIGEAELKFLQYVSGFTGKFLFVQNKRDLGDPLEQGEPVWKRREREHRRRISEVLRTQDFPIYHVSALQGARGFRRNDLRDWEGSGIPALRVALEEFLVNVRSGSRWDEWCRRTEYLFRLVQVYLNNQEETLRNRLNEVAERLPSADEYEQWRAAAADLATFGRDHLRSSIDAINRLESSLVSAVSSEARSALSGISAERLASSSDQVHRVERSIVRSVQTEARRLLSGAADRAMTLLYQGVEQTLGQRVPESMRRFLTSADPADAVRSLSVSLHRSYMVDSYTHTVEREATNFFQKVGFGVMKFIGRPVTEQKTVYSLNESYVQGMATDLARSAVATVRDHVASQLEELLNAADREIRRVAEAAHQASEAARNAQTLTLEESRAQLQQVEEARRQVEALAAEVAELKKSATGAH